jgi:adenylyl- and sulfurtransferase ThiI
VFEIDNLYEGRLTVGVNWRALTRAIAVKFAIENRFKGIIFGDVSGHLSSLGGSYSTSTGPPIFYPLLGVEEEDLSELSTLAGVDESELMSQGGFNRVPEQPSGEMELRFGELVLPAVREIHF